MPQGGHGGPPTDASADPPTGPSSSPPGRDGITFTSDLTSTATARGAFTWFGRWQSRVLGIVTVTTSRARSLSALISADAEGHVERYPGYLEWVVPEFEVDSGRELLDIGIDGEAVRLPAPLRFRSPPAAQRVRLPRHTPGNSPTAAAQPRTWRAAVAPRSRGPAPGTRGEPAALTRVLIRGHRCSVS